MLRKFRKLTFALFILVSWAGLTSCNEGEAGFDAPQGSSVSLTNITGDTVSVPSGSAIAYVSAFVALPGGVPGNNIELTFSCTPQSRCTMLNSDGGVEGDPFIVASDSEGRYRLGLQLQAPSNFGQITSYSVTVSASISTSVATKTVSVSE